MLIEDDSAVARSIELMLKSEGFNVYTTDLGEEGIDLGKIYDYDIILLDLNLPDMSGFEVLRSMRLSKVKAPILILTGVDTIEDKSVPTITSLSPSTRTNWWHASMRSCGAPKATRSLSFRPETFASTPIQKASRSMASPCI